MKSGQILILVLLMVVVVLAVGLSVASRNITNLRTSVQTEQSQRVFTAAEGGVEDVLSKLSDITKDINAINVGVGAESGCDISGDIASCDIKIGDSDITADVQVEVSRVYEKQISLGDVGQIVLSNASGRVQIEWAKIKNPLEIPPTTDAPASIEVTQIYNNIQQRWYLEGVINRGGENLISNPEIFNCGANASGDFEKCVQLDILGPSPQILRIKPFWIPTTVRVLGIPNPLPVQIYDVTSSASTDIGITRKVEVKRTALPQLPAVFDYVLYSEGNIVK